MVGREHEEIAGPQLRQDARQFRIEGFERAAITNGIAAVAELAVEIDEIRHQEAAVGQAIHVGQRRVHESPVARDLDLAARAHMGIDVADLTHRYDIAARSTQHREQRG